MKPTARRNNIVHMPSLPSHFARFAVVSSALFRPCCTWRRAQRLHADPILSAGHTYSLECDASGVAHRRGNPAIRAPRVRMLARVVRCTVCSRRRRLVFSPGFTLARLCTRRTGYRSGSTCHPILYGAGNVALLHASRTTWQNGATARRSSPMGRASDGAATAAASTLGRHAGATRNKRGDHQGRSSPFVER